MGKWLTEGYAIPGAVSEEAEELPSLDEIADKKLH